MKKVLLLTNKYPYSPPIESFLETELEFYGDKKITIAPSKTDHSKRSVNKDIEINRELSDLLNNKKIKLKSILESLINVIFIKEFFNEKLYLSLSKFKWALGFFSGAIIVRKFLDNSNCDVAYSYWLNYLSLGIALSNCPCKVSRAHGIDLYSESSKVKYQPFQSYIVKKLDRIYCISEDGRNYLNDRYNTDNLFVSRLGVKVGHDVISEIVDLRKSNVINVVSCSYILPIKRLDFIFSWLQEISKYKKVYWTHIGGPVPGLEGIKTDILSRISNTGNLSVNFVGGMSNKDIITFYSKNKFDLFMNMSDSEGIPVSIMEALFFGIPVIARNVGGIKELIDGKNGLFVSKNVNDRDLNRILSYKNNRKTIQGSIKEKYSANKNYCEFWRGI